MRALSTERMLNINNAHYVDYVLGYSPKWWKTLTLGAEQMKELVLLFYLRTKTIL